MCIRSRRCVRAIPTLTDCQFVDIRMPESYQREQPEHLRVRKRPAIFFDRDGTLNEDLGYTHRIEDLCWMPGAREAIALANARDYFVFVVTNQSGVARGYYSEKAIAGFHQAMQEALSEVGAHIDAFEWCPHHEDGTVPRYRVACRCRKPGTGMLDDLIAAWPVDVGRSLMIGDSDVDMMSASAAGVRGVRYSGGSLVDILATELDKDMRS